MAAEIIKFPNDPGPVESARCDFAQMLFALASAEAAYRQAADAADRLKLAENASWFRLMATSTARQRKYLEQMVGIE